MYLGLLVHGETRKQNVTDKLNDLGMSISYNRVLELSTDLGNTICSRFETENIVCPSNLRKGLFTTGAVDNIDHNSTSTTAQGSFHGTGISVFQHPTSECIGEARTILQTDTNIVSTNRQGRLPEVYTSVHPVGECKLPEVPKQPGPSGSDGECYSEPLLDE